MCTWLTWRRCNCGYRALTGENWIMVAAGLARLNARRFGCQNRRAQFLGLNTREVGFQLAPR
jgi:single-stranded DNA-specific DHH superfamily exonuclease